MGWSYELARLTKNRSAVLEQAAAQGVKKDGNNNKGKSEYV